MAGDKTYSEDEHLAILSDRVTKETAGLTAERDQLSGEKTELENKLDVETSAKTAAEQRATEAEKALEDFKTQVEGEREAASRKEERVKKVRETAGHLGDDFFTDEKRIARIVAMAEEDFEGYLADLSVTAKAAPASTTTTTVPRETAMQGDPVGVGANGHSSARDFLLRGYIAPSKED